MKKLKQIINKSISFQQLFVSGGTTLMFRIAGLFINFFITFFITKNYGEGIYGNYSLIFTLLQASTMVFALGLPNALISYLGLHTMNDHFSQFLLRKGLKICVLSALIPSVFYFLFKEIIATGVFNNNNLILYIAIVAFSLPFCILHEFFLNFFIATKNFLRFNIFMFVLPNILFLFFLIVFPITQQNQHFTLLFYALSIAITVVFELFFVFKKHKKVVIDRLTSKQIIQFSSPMMLSSLMLFLLNWTDVFMLGAMRTENEVGIYNIAYKLASLSMLIIISMNIVLGPKIAQMFQSNEMEELHAIVKKATRLVFLLTLPLVVFLIIFRDFILALFGSNFVQGQTALILISAGVLINVATGNVDQILNMTNNQKVLKNATIMGFFLNVILNYMLIPLYGINGSAAASLLTNVVFNIVCLVYIKKKLGFYTFI